MLHLPRVSVLALAVMTLMILQSRKLGHFSQNVKASHRHVLHAPPNNTNAAQGAPKTQNPSPSNTTTSSVQDGGEREPLQTKHVRYLFGIFSSQGEKDQIRRNLIRSTYLKYYIHPSTSSNATGRDNVICSLSELQEDYQRLPKDRIWQDCQIVFTFVVGAGNDQAPTERLGYSLNDDTAYQDQEPFTLSNHPNISADEKDITFLNIRENMNEGKSQTWLHYGALWARRLNIDYIVKLDSDAIVFPDCFLEQMTDKFGLTKITVDPDEHNNNNTPATAVYGGFPWDLHCTPAQYPFHSGHFYFLSADLALDVTRDDCNRTGLEFSFHRIATIPGCPSHMQKILQNAVSVLDGAEDMSVGNFVTECRRRPVKFVSMGGPEWGKQGPAVAHPQIPEETPHTARLKEPHRYRRYYHLRNLMVRTERLIDRDSTQARLKTAICHQTSLLAIPGHDNHNDANIVDLYDVMEWAIYHRLLGFDHIYLTYVNHDTFRHLPGFETLNRLPYVTLTNNAQGNVIQDGGTKNGTYTLGGDCESQCVIRDCLGTTASQGYDWVWVANMDEYLWYNQTLPVHEFLAHIGGDKYDYLSFGKHKYSTHYRRQLTPGSSSEPLSGFMAEEYPFTTETHYCERQSPSGGICPMQYAQSRVMVRPHWFFNQVDKIQAHGNALHEDKNTTPVGERTWHLPTNLAHMKQWVTPTSLRLPLDSAVVDTTSTDRVVLLSNDTEVPYLQGGWGTAADGTENKTASLTLHFDKGLQEWFQFVASRGLKPNVCSNLFPTGREVRHNMP